MNILIASSIDPETIDKLKNEHQLICAFNETFERLQSVIQDRELIIFRSGVSITADLMECAPNLKWLIRAGSGLDNLDVEYVRRRGLKLARIPGPGAKAVSEMSFAFMLALSRRLFEADHSMREGRWAKTEMVGSLLRDKVLGIVGVGNIGSQVAALGVAWGMQVVGCVEFPTPERVEKMSQRGIQLTDFEEVISTADYVTIHVPLKDSTRYMFDAGALSQMKPGSYLINLARGGVVDEQALFKVLSDGDTLRGVALDVHEQEGEGKLSPLAGLPNVILTPHIGAMVSGTQRLIGLRIQELVAEFMANGN